MPIPYIKLDSSNILHIDTSGSGEYVVVETSNGTYHLEPELFCFMQDDACALGSGSHTFKELYLGSGTVHGSDERIKSNVGDIPNAVLDAWSDVTWCQYKMNNAIQKKGESTARFHVGLIAQKIKDVFESHGLDACKYGLICHETWDARPAVQDENGNIVEPAIEAGDIWMLRYSECLAVEAAYQRRCIAQLEERINQLTNSNN